MTPPTAGLAEQLEAARKMLLALEVTAAQLKELVERTRQALDEAGELVAAGSAFPDPWQVPELD
jgi:hypothetical protein